MYCGEGEYFGKCKEVAGGLVGGNGVLNVGDLLCGYRTERSEEAMSTITDSELRIMYWTRGTRFLTLANARVQDVDNSGGGFINVYRINPTDHTVTLTEQIPLGSACDNLSYDPVNDALLVATFPDIPAFFDHYHNPYTNTKAPIAIDRIKRLADPEPGKTKHKVGIVLFAKALTGGVSIALADSEVRKSLWVYPSERERSGLRSGLVGCLIVRLGCCFFFVFDRIGGIKNSGIVVCKDRVFTEEEGVIPA